MSFGRHSVVSAHPRSPAHLEPSWNLDHGSMGFCHSFANNGRFSLCLRSPFLCYPCSPHSSFNLSSALKKSFALYISSHKVTSIFLANFAIKGLWAKSLLKVPLVLSYSLGRLLWALLIKPHKVHLQPFVLSLIHDEEVCGWPSPTSIGHKLH